MNITDFLKPMNVELRGAPLTKTALLEAVTSRLQESGGITEAETCLRALLEREKLMTTGVGKGVALPHAFTPSAPETIIFYMRIPEGTDFSAVDESPIHHLFCMLGPPSAQGRHLKVLARMARLMNLDSFLDDLAAAENADELIASISSHEARL